jgi:hypothetical protein
MVAILGKLFHSDTFIAGGRNCAKVISVWRGLRMSLPDGACDANFVQKLD